MQAETGVGRVRLVWPFVAIATTYLYFFAGSYFGIYVAAVRASSTVLLAIAFALWVLLAWRRPAWRPRSVLLPAFGVAIAALIVTTLTSTNPRVSLDFVAYSVLLVGLYGLLRQLMTEPSLRRRMTALVTLLTVALLVAYLATVTMRWITWWGLVGEVVVPPLRPFYEGLSFGNPGAVAVLAVLGFIVSVAHVGWESRRAVAGLAVMAVMTAAVVFITASRASWLAAGVTVLVFGVIAATSRRARAAVRAGIARPGGKVAAVVAVVAIVAAAVVIAPRVVERFLTGGTEAERASFAAVSLRMAGDRPLTGVGPGMWAPARIAYTQPPEVDYYIPHAHNLFTQTAAELGLIGVLAGVVLVVFGGILLRSALRDADAERRRWAWATAVATLYFVVHQQLDLFANLPTVLFVFAVPWAWLDATEQRPVLRFAPLTSRRVKPILSAAGVVALVLALGWCGYSDRAAVMQDDALTAGEGGRAGEALALLQEAETMDPAMPAHLLPLGLAQHDTPVDALATFTKLTESDDLPTAWVDRAALELQLGRPDAARASVDRSLRLGDQQPGVLLAAGYLYEQLGDLDASDLAYSAALVLDPRMAGDPFWQADGRAERWPGIRARAIDGLDPDGTVNLQLSERRTSGDAGPSTIDLGATSPVIPLVVDAWDGREGAVDALYEWTREHPADLVALAWAARVAARTGDLDRAQAYRDWMDTVWGTTGASGAEVTIDMSPAPDAPHTGLHSVAWGIYTYRRPTPTDQLLPGLPHLVLTQ